MKYLPDVIQFPDGAESSPFFGALASALIPALGYAEDMPFYCDQKGSLCINCGNCNNSTLRKHRCKLYHDYQSFTGVSLGWVWPEEDSEYQTLPGWRKGWRWPDEFFGFIFGYAGLSWKRLSEGCAKNEAMDAIKDSIGAGLPVLLKLGDGPKTDYALPPNAAELLLLKREAQTELKRLFAIVFENDRVVLCLLREAADIIT